MLSLGLLILSNVALGHVSAGHVTVQLPAEATVLGSEMTLGQIATITGSDPSEVARVEGLVLGYAPSPSYSRVIQRWKLVDSLKKQVADVDVYFTGEATCRVWPSTVTIAGQELRTKGRQTLESLFVDEDFQVRPLGELHDELVPTGIERRELAANASLASMSIGANRVGTWNVPVQILIDGTPYRTVWTSFEVDLYRVLPVLVRDVAKGERLTPADVVMKRTAVRDAAGFQPMTGTMLNGATVNRALRQDQPVGINDVTRVLAVKKGETVDLLVTNGAILVNTRVIALQDGHIGDLVNVQVMGAGKELTATVDRKNHLRLSLSDYN